MKQSKPKLPPLSPEDTERLKNVSHGVRKFSRKQKLTTPLYSMAHLASLTVQATSEPYEADFVLQLPGKDDSKPTVIKVTNMDDGEDAVLILNSIMLSSLLRAGGPLTGRFFKFTANGIREGKNYRDIDVEELQED